MSNAIHKMRKKVKKYLDQDRYEHTLGVMYLCASLAMRYNEDINEGSGAAAARKPLLIAAVLLAMC